MVVIVLKDLDSRLIQDQDFDVQDQDRDSRLMRPYTGKSIDWNGLWQTKLIANRKSVNVRYLPFRSIVAHSEQLNIIPCLTAILFQQFPVMCRVYQTNVYMSTWFQDRDKTRGSKTKTLRFKTKTKTCENASWDISRPRLKSPELPSLFVVVGIVVVVVVCSSNSSNVVVRC